MGNILAWEHSGPGFNAKYQLIHSDSNAHLEWMLLVLSQVAGLRNPRDVDK